MDTPGPQPTAREAPAAPSSPARRPRTRWRMLLYGAAAGLVLAVAGEAGRVMLGDNFHVVLPGRVYRTAQLSGPALERLIRDHHIRTVVNLRGCCAPFPWYLDECRATHDLDVNQEDVNFSAGRLPSSAELRRFLEVLDHGEYPMVLHCRRGADRTGMAVAIILLLQTNVDLDRACRQLGLRYGHVALGRPAYLDQFFALYRDWLRSKNLDHTPAHFRRWLEKEYCPGECRCRLELPGFTPRLPRDKPFPLLVRATNTSVQTWHFQPETNAGTHVRFVLWDDDGNQLASERAGLFNAEVPPGRSIDLTLALPALKKPGRYRLLVDMTDEKQCWFFQTGSEPLEKELLVSGK